MKPPFYTASGGSYSIHQSSSIEVLEHVILTTMDAEVHMNLISTAQWENDAA